MEEEEGAVEEEEGAVEEQEGAAMGAAAPVVDTLQEVLLSCSKLHKIFPSRRPDRGGIMEESRNSRRSRSVGYGISDPYVMKKHESLSPSPIGRIGIAAGDDDELRRRTQAASRGNSTRSHDEVSVGRCQHVADSGCRGRLAWRPADANKDVRTKGDHA